MTCPHLSFHATVNVGRLSEVEGGPVTGWTASITIVCPDCKMPFRFIGVPAGADYASPRVSIDGTELRAPMEPAEHQKFQTSATYAVPPKVRH